MFAIDFSGMASDVSLAINMGSPFTGDGLRPVMPHVIKGSISLHLIISFNDGK